MCAKLARTLVVAALLLSGLLLALPTITALSQATGFIITSADATSYVTTTSSSQMNTLIGGVAPRFVVQYANGMRYDSIPPIPSTLTALVAQVGARFVVQYANANRFYGFTYPVQMIGDTTPPQITAPIVSLSGGSATISWFTNEFATTLFKYGTQSGAYTRTVTDTLFYKLHEFTLTGLTSGQRYYYRVQHTDRNGNVFQSQEYNFIVNRLVYLPVVLKR